ncbi:MAG: GNAT family N-acetyltransferase [Candidatus Riflebacteria bacterium]|nr:GNAT family N-acetyltransferase [Candidatus Riflebacteria bacterium]
MSFEFITDLKRWQQLFETLPDFCGKVYYQPDYYRAYAANGDGQPAALYFKQGTTEIFYPFLLRPIPECIGGKGFFDMQTAYGYGGPVIFGITPKTATEYCKSYTEWADNTNIVAEFVRFNPLLDSNLTAEIYKLEVNRKTVSMDLSENFASILQQSASARQRNYRKAVKAGLKFVTLPDLSSFIEMYRQTMQRLTADEYYYFSSEYFAVLESLPENSRLFAGVENNNCELLATGIYLLDRQSVHYHLGASTGAEKELQPNAFMMLEAARHTAQAGKNVLHLGGGLSFAEDDGLYRFKSGFSRQRHDFYIARKIHRPQQYKQFSDAWRAITGKEPGILLHYHEGLQHADI